MKFDWDTSARPYARSAERNTDPILGVLRQHFGDRKRVLEIGSGTGQHAVRFAAAFPGAAWQPSDLAENLPGIRMWVDEARLPNLLPPLPLDVNGPWPAGRYDAAFTANTLHIMGWEEVQKLFTGLDGVLEHGALLAVYGPFNYGGTFTSDSNRAFDESLRRNSAVSAIRDFEAVDGLARSIGLQLVADHAMPANNHMPVWQRGAGERRPQP
jgi:hypothetical protein